MKTFLKFPLIWTPLFWILIMIVALGEKSKSFIMWVEEIEVKDGEMRKNL